MLWRAPNGRIITLDNGKIANTDECPCDCLLCPWLVPNNEVHVGSNYQFSTINEAITYIENNLEPSSYKIILHAMFNETIVLDNNNYSYVLAGAEDEYGLTGAMSGAVRRIYVESGKFSVELPGNYLLYAWKAYLKNITANYDCKIYCRCSVIDEMYSVPYTNYFGDVYFYATIGLYQSKFINTSFTNQECAYDIEFNAEKSIISNIFFRDSNPNVYVHGGMMWVNIMANSIFENIQFGSGGSGSGDYGARGGGFVSSGASGCRFNGITFGAGGDFIDGRYGGTGGGFGYNGATRYTDCEFTAISFGSGGNASHCGGAGGGLTINNSYEYGQGDRSDGKDCIISNCTFDGIICGNGGDADIGGAGGGFASGGYGGGVAGTLTCLETNIVNNVISGNGGSGNINGTAGVIKCTN